MDFSGILYFSRTTASETMTFISRTVIDRTLHGHQQVINHLNKDCYSFVASSGLACAVLTDEGYPAQAAFGLARKCVTQFSDKFMGRKWEEEKADLLLEGEWLQKILTECQDPKKADVVHKIMSDLQDTEKIMRKNIEDLLTRGEKLDTLVAKTDDLSIASKRFVKDAQKLNSCCWLF